MTTQISTPKPDIKLLLGLFLTQGSAQTQRSHLHALKDFTLFLELKELEEAVICLLKKEQGALNALAFAYRQHQIVRKLSPATTNLRLCTLRSLLKLARMLGLSMNSIEVDNLTLEQYRDTRGPGHDGMRLMMKALERNDAKGARDRAILHLLYDLAMRRAEVCSLDYGHVDMSEEPCLWVLGKGRNSRIRMTLPDETKEALAAWLVYRGTAPGALFWNLDQSHGQGRLTDSTVYRVVVALGQKVGIKTRPHGLRHAAITYALDATKGDVRAVQRFSRHKSLNILLIYDDQRKDLGGEVSRLVAKSLSTEKEKEP